MRESAVMGEAESRTAQTTEYVQIGSFCRQRKRGRRQCSFPIQSDAPEARSGQKVGYGFQVIL
jgi:hypothetical protein